ncbi:hypothetical protein ACWEF6_01845 [Amycolatopsis sp. NPDC004772]
MIIDKPKAIELLERAVAEKGADYVDPGSQWGKGGCRYVREDACGCIVGHAYFYAGATLEQLKGMDNHPDDPGVATLAYDELLPVETTPDAVSAFEVAQRSQDRGESWGTALEKAKAV